MDAKTIMIGVVVAVVAVGGAGYFFSVGNNLVPPATTQDQVAVQENTDDSGTAESLGVNEIVTVETIRSGGSKEHTVEITDSGYSPKELTIKAGDTVTFVNDGGSSWPATDAHPTHTLYPGSDIAKCGSGAAMFDSCGEIAKGGSWSFKFDEVGEWGYHDHLRPSLRGTITVQ